MKYYFINPPSYISDLAPISGIPTLLGILEKNNIETKFFDFNLKYCNWLISKDGINEIIDYYNFLLSHRNDYFSFLIDEPQKIDRNICLVKKTAKNLDFCVSILKSKKFFSDFLFFIYASRSIFIIIEYLGDVLKNALKYFIPDIVDFRSNFDNPNFQINVAELIMFFESQFIPFKSFCDEELQKIIDENPDIVGISINHPISIFSGLYIGYRLKQKTKIHINIGGSFFNYFYKLNENLNELFGIFFDSISIGNNTKTVLDLVTTIENNLDFENVPNLIYLQNNNLKINISKDKIHLDDLPFPSFNGYQISNYLIPEKFIPIVTSESCYWHKCNFCEFCNKHYSCKSPEKIFEELKFLSKKYNTKYFYFWDNAMHPKILDKLADLIIKNKLDVRYSIYARFEETFTSSLLKKMRKSGCLYINWGLDSASERMLKIINKGISLNTAKRILKDSYNIGIGTNTYIILGHPYEEIEDLEQNVKFVEQNKKYIDNLGVIPHLVFIEGSIINEERDKYRAAIKTTESDRKYYAKKLNSLCNSGVESIRFSVYVTLYIDKKGIKRYRLEKKLFFIFRRFSNILHFYIDINKFFWNKKQMLKNILKRVNNEIFTR